MRVRVPTWLQTHIANLLIGGLLGGTITAHFVELHSDRELQRTWLQERSKHQMAVRKSYLDEQRATVESLYGILSRLRIASNDLIDITSPEYDAENFAPGEPRVGMEKLKIERRNAYNDALDAWERSRYFYDFALSAYRGDAGVQRAWTRTRDAATEHADCASGWYFDVFNSKVRYTATTPTPCMREAKTLDDEWRKLSAALRAARQSAWNDWENPPQRLK